MKIPLFSIFGCILLLFCGNVGGNKLPAPLLDNQNAPLVAMVDMSNADEHVKEYVNDAIKTQMSQLVTTKLGEVLESLKLEEKLEHYIDQVKQNLTLDVTDDIKRIVDESITAKGILFSTLRLQIHHQFPLDLIIFPDDIEFKHVTQCTTGRVYVLKFKTSSRKFFFWMQEPKNDKDEEYRKKVNEYLNNPPTPGSSRGAGLSSDLSGLGDSDLQSILGGMSQQQLMQLLGPMGMGGPGGGLSALMGARPSSAQSTASEPPLRVQSSPGTRGSSNDQQRPVTAAALPSQNTTASTTTTTTGTTSVTAGAATTTSTGGSKTPIQLSDLQNILSSMNVPTTPKESVDLVQALNPESMIPILANAEVQERLVKFLPEGETLPKTEQELRNTIQSPQFQQALSSFSAALLSGQLGPLMSQFGLGEEVANAAAQGDLGAFVKAMQEQQKKKDSDDDKMDTK